MSTPHHQVQIPKLLDITSVKDDRGSLLSVEYSILPFAPQRSYFITARKSEVPRVAHAHKELEQLIFPLEGSWLVEVQRGPGKYKFQLSDMEQALFIPREYWREIYCLSPKGILGLIVSQAYTEQDYIRNFADYVKWLAID